MEENRKDKGSNSRFGRLFKKELNKKLIIVIVWCFCIFYFDVFKKEDRILINEIFDDFE